jgi:hypothetical protein
VHGERLCHRRRRPTVRAWQDQGGEEGEEFVEVRCKDLGGGGAEGCEGGEEGGEGAWRGLEGGEGGEHGVDEGAGLGLDELGAIAGG